MAKRRITHTRKDREGDILDLCRPGEGWSPCFKAQAIDDIESGAHQYYVRAGFEEGDTYVVPGPSGKYLRTDPDKTRSNNLDDLADC